MVSVNPFLLPMSVFSSGIVFVFKGKYHALGFRSFLVIRSEVNDGQELDF